MYSELFDPASSNDPWVILAKLADRPDGAELLREFRECYRDIETAKRLQNQPIEGRAASRVVLIESLEFARESLIIVSPWLSKRSVDEEILLRMTALLDRGCHLCIGWGYSYDIRGLHPKGNVISITRDRQFSMSGDRIGNYNALSRLIELRSRFPDRMELKLMGTHEKYLVCDRQFALLGSHNILSSGDTLYAPREMGVKTTDAGIIETLRENYGNAPDLRHVLHEPEKVAAIASSIF